MSQSLDVKYISLLSALSNKSAFRRLDTHLTSNGCQIVTNTILQQLSAEYIHDFLPCTHVYRIGDLSQRFLQLPIYDLDVQPKLPGPEPVEIMSAQPNRVGGHIGSQKIWSNPRAPVDKKIIIFGNSLFGEGTSPTTLNWWFARTFSLLKFVFTPEYDHELTMEFRPDIVICQTIERFLKIVPSK